MGEGVGSLADTILNNAQSPILPEFKRISMTKELYDPILSLTKDSFRRYAQNVICPISL